MNKLDSTDKPGPGAVQALGHRPWGCNAELLTQLLPPRRDPRTSFSSPAPCWSRQHEAMQPKVGTTGLETAEPWAQPWVGGQSLSLLVPPHIGTVG